MGLNGTLRTADVNVSGGWTRQAFPLTSSTGIVTPPSNYIQSQSDFRIRKSRFGGALSFNYDVTRSTLVNHRYIAFYNAQCCGVNFEYQAFNYPTNSGFLLPKDRRFNMSFTLAGVGSFSNFFGAFGGSTY